MRQHPPDSTIESLNLWQSEKIDDQFHQYHPPRFPFNCRRAGRDRCFAIPANAADASSPDPIFEAIEAHKAARLAFENAVSRGSALEEELPGEKTRSWITVWEEDDCRNRRSAMDRQRARGSPHLRCRKRPAAPRQTSPRPRWRSGAVAAIRYRHSPRRWPEGVQSDDGPDPAMAQPF